MLCMSRFTFTCLFFSLQNDQVLQGFSVDKGEFTCPLCRQFANSVLPCRPGRGTEAGTWHTPTNKKMCVLVKEVEDLQEKIGLFPVSFSAGVCNFIHPVIFTQMHFKHAFNSLLAGVHIDSDYHYWKQSAHCKL